MCARMLPSYDGGLEGGCACRLWLRGMAETAKTLKDVLVANLQEFQQLGGVVRAGGLPVNVLVLRAILQASPDKASLPNSVQEHAP